MILLVAGFTASCAPVRENRRMDPHPAAPVRPTVVPVAATPPASAPIAPTVPASPPQRVFRSSGGLSLEGVVFDSRGYRLEVADQPGGPGSQWADSQAAASARGGLAAINAGFFTPEGRPLGLVVSHGGISGGWNAGSSLGSGLWFQDKGGHSGIARREAIGNEAARSMEEAIQAGPMLVEQGAPVPGLDAIKSSPRTVLLWDGGTRWMLAHVDACTLAELARGLAGTSPGWPVKTALNLDGGRSAELWISPQILGGGSLTRPFWNKPVRNFLILKPR